MLFTMKTKLFACLTIVAVVAGGTLAWWHWMIPPAPSNRPQMWWAAERLVEDALKAPSTASFPWRGRSYTEFQGGWVLTGPVDAENAFGAKLRAKWEVTISKRNDGSWYCSWVEVSEPDILHPDLR